MPSTAPDYRAAAKPRETATDTLSSHLTLVGGGAETPPQTASALPNLDVNQLLMSLVQQAHMLPAQDIPLPLLQRIRTDCIYYLRHTLHRSERTLEDYDYAFRRLEAYLERIGRDACGESELRAFLVQIVQEETGNRRVMPAGSRAREKTYNNLRACFNWAVKFRYIVKSPLDNIPVPYHKPAEREPFDTTVLIRLLAASKQPVAGQPPSNRDFAMLLTMFDCGLRAEETCNLVFENFSFEKRTLKVLHGKGDKSRTVVMSPLTAGELWTYLQEGRRHSTSPLFHSVRGGALTRSGLLQIYRRLASRAGLPPETPCHPHLMRHTFATFYLLAEGKIDDLQRLLGHTKAAMAQHYAKTLIGDLSEKHFRASPVVTLFSTMKK